MNKRKKRLTKAKKRRRNIIRFILFLLLSVSAYKGMEYLMTNWSHYNIETVEINGARLYKTDLSQKLKGKNIFKIDLRALHRAIAEEEYVESVEVRRILPGKIEITVYERIPVAVVSDKKGLFRCIDAHGYEFNDPSGRILPRIYEWEKNKEAVLELYASGAFSYKGYEVTEIKCGNIYELTATYRNREGQKMICNYGSGDYISKTSALEACVDSGKTALYADLRFLPYVVLGNGGGV